MWAPIQEGCGSVARQVICISIPVPRNMHYPEAEVKVGLKKGKTAQHVTCCWISSMQGVDLGDHHHII